MSSVSLLSASQGGSGGQFKVFAKSRNGDVSLNFPQAPLDSVQQIDAQTSNGRMTLQMHPTFEGEFKVETSNAQPSVVDNARVPDPAGIGRQRNVQQQRGRKATLSGSAVWGEPAPGKTMGSVYAKSTNGDVRILF